MISGITATCRNGNLRYPPGPTFVPVRTLPEMILGDLSTFTLSLSRAEMQIPSVARTIAGFFTASPVMATTHDQSTYPSVKSFPIFTTVSGSIAHTTSPLFTGRMLAICVPALPAGCGPLRINDSEKSVSIKFSLWHPIYTIPAVSLDRTSTPFLKHSSLLSINKVCEGARGEESKVDMKMSRGVASGDGTIPYGRCLKKPISQIPTERL